MKFQLSTSKYFYSDEEIEKFKELGFTFGRYEDKLNDNKNTIKGNPIIELNSLKELEKFVEEWGALVFIPKNRIVKDSKLKIEIYNDYRE